LAVIALETTALVVGLSLSVFGVLDRYRRLPPPVPVFRPPIADAVIGELARYEKRDRETGRVLGYLEYEVRRVEITEGTTIGPEIVLAIKETDALGTSRERLMSFQPRALMDGFLPPRFDDEDDYPAGERPVASRISTATFRIRERPPGSPLPPPAPVHGFLIEAVIPRRSLTDVQERFWITDKVAVFGVARWERGNEVLVLHHDDWPRRKA